jgi:hypothetical protein
LGVDHLLLKWEVDILELGIYGMAAHTLIVCNPLCFLLAKLSNTSIKTLKSALTDFYNDKELTEAKQLLLADLDRITETNTELKPPRVPARREGHDKLLHEVDDIILLLTFIDEQKLTNCLPSYVSDNPDHMPSVRLYEGDLKIILEYISRMNNRMCAIDSTLTSVRHDVHALQHNSAARLPASVSHQSTPLRPVNHSDVFSHAQSTSLGSSAVQGSCAMSSSVLSTLPNATTVTTFSATTESISAETANKTTVSANPSSKTWASRVENSNRFTIIETDDTHSLNGSQSRYHSGSESAFIEVDSARLRRKRRRQRSVQQKVSQPVDAADPGTHQMSAQISTQKSVPPKHTSLVIGKSTQVNSNIAAARALVKKAVFYVDNVDPSVTVSDMVDFVTSLSVKVITCFETKPRKRRSAVYSSERQCKAFRLCINNDHRQRFLDAENWPEYIAISDWFFKTHGEQTARNELSGNQEKVRPSNFSATDAATYSAIATTTHGAISEAVTSAASAAAELIDNTKTIVNDNTDNVAMQTDMNLSCNSLSDTIIYNAVT